MRERRARFAAAPRQLEEIIIEGSRVTRREAEETLHLCLSRMGMEYFRQVGPDDGRPGGARRTGSR